MGGASDGSDDGVKRVTVALCELCTALRVRHDMHALIILCLGSRQTYIFTSNDTGCAGHAKHSLRLFHYSNGSYVIAEPSARIITRFNTLQVIQDTIKVLHLHAYTLSVSVVLPVNNCVVWHKH